MVSSSPPHIPSLHPISLLSPLNFLFSTSLLLSLSPSLFLRFYIFISSAAAIALSLPPSISLSLSFILSFLPPILRSLPPSLCFAFHFLTLSLPTSQLTFPSFFPSFSLPPSLLTWNQGIQHHCVLLRRVNSDPIVALARVEGDKLVPRWKFIVEHQHHLPSTLFKHTYTIQHE